MKLPLLRAFWRMVIPLQAREAMATSQAVAIGTGSLKPGDAASTLARWRSAANYASEGPPAFRPKSRAERLAMIQGLGIPVIIEPRSNDE